MNKEELSHKIMENSENFTAFATMEAAMYMMNEIKDKHTGSTKEMAKLLIPILEDYLEAKSILGITTEKDVEMLEATRSMANLADPSELN